MGSEAVRVQGKAAPETMIQEDNIPDSTKMIILGVIVLIALLACFASGAGHSGSEEQQAGYYSESKSALG